MKIEHRVSPAEYILIYALPTSYARLDTFLNQQGLPRSRHQIQTAIVEGLVEIKRQAIHKHRPLGRIRPSTSLLAGDEVWVKTQRKPEPPVAWNYRFLHEEKSFVLVDKPGNLPVHPAGRYFFHTLLTHLEQHPEHGKQAWFPVHRLDRETSGLLVLAKESRACAKLVAQFASRQVQKKYLALVRGECPLAFDITAPLGHCKHSAIHLKMVSSTEGLPAETAFSRLQLFEHPEHGCFSLVACFPKTGRQHQIRAHLDLAGHPIVGDKLYGLPEEEALHFYETGKHRPATQAKLLLPRHALHASELGLKHPETGETLTFSSPLPEDLTQFIQQLKPLREKKSKIPLL